MPRPPRLLPPPVSACRHWRGLFGCVRESGPDGALPPSADRDAIASGVSVPAPATAAHVSFPARAVSSRALRLRPEADAPGLIRAILRHALNYRELCLKSPLVRPSLSTSGLSLSDDAAWIALVGWLNQRILVAVKVTGAPVATWPWPVQGGSGRPRCRLAPIMWWRFALCRARACPPPCSFCSALV